MEISVFMPNQSALEQEFAGRAMGLARWLRAKDRGVLLALALCLAPFPPVFLVGTALNLLNLRLAALKKIQPGDKPVIYAGFAAAAAYMAIWTGLLWSLLHYGQLHAFAAFLHNLADWATGGFLSPHTMPGSNVHRI